VARADQPREDFVAPKAAEAPQQGLRHAQHQVHRLGLGEAPLSLPRQGGSGRQHEVRLPRRACLRPPFVARLQQRGGGVRRVGLEALEAWWRVGLAPLYRSRAPERAELGSVRLKGAFSAGLTGFLVAPRSPHTRPSATPRRPSAAHEGAGAPQQARDTLGERREEG